jgi:hypothetical protein
MIGISTRARVMGFYWDYNADLRGCDFVPPAATATQRSTALWRQNPSRRDLYGESRVREGALPLPRRIVDGPEDRGWSRPNR